MWIVFEPEGSSSIAHAIPVARINGIDLEDERDDLDGEPDTLAVIITHEASFGEHRGQRTTIASGPADEMRLLFASLLSLTSRLDISTAVHVHLEGGAWRCERMAEPKAARPPFVVKGLPSRRP